MESNQSPRGPKPRILVVEDEPHLAFNLQLNLNAEGYHVTIAVDGPGALKAYTNDGPFDLIILDVMIPEINGFNVAKAIRSHDDQTQILMLTAMGREEEKLKGFEAGVDDYVTKPFHLQEFLLRVRRMVRRSQYFSRDSIAKPLPELSEISSPRAPPLKFGPFTLDTELLELSTPKSMISLTALEADVLKEFFRSPDRVLSRAHLLEHVWGIKGDIETRTVDNFIVRLRRYLEEDPTKPKYLVSVRGRGYRLTEV